MSRVTKIIESAERTTSVKVELSLALIRLLSEQLYQNPHKAIEELVVNAYDAAAKVCRVSIPEPADADNVDPFIAVFDDGEGMDESGLANLWQIGRSSKRREEEEREFERRTKRKSIGKFGIGKLASYTIADRLTYVTKTSNRILAVSVDFSEFDKHDADHASSNDSSKIVDITLPVYIVDWKRFSREARVKDIIKGLGVNKNLDELESWTLSIMEGLKTHKATKITRGQLEWVLSTAMPLKSDFRVFINGEEVKSSKENYEIVVEFDIADLPPKRLDNIASEKGHTFRVEAGKLVSEIFPSGITGEAIVTRKVLYGGKSDDIIRSHGFFVRVRERVVDLVDPLFGLKPLRYGLLNRFRADVNVDDLDHYLTAARSSVKESEATSVFRSLLHEIALEADARYNRTLEEESKKRSEERETRVELVAPSLVEFPIADAILARQNDKLGTEADGSWFYLRIDEGVDIHELVENLYMNPRSKYSYTYHTMPTKRIVQFNPVESEFLINLNHELVREYASGDEKDARALQLLEEIITAETALEAYLRESSIPPRLIGDILERRDHLLRSLALDHPYSVREIARHLRDSASAKKNLEMYQVFAARALGFSAIHLGENGKPDGVARFCDYAKGEQKIILEAKSSARERLKEADLKLSGIHKHISDQGAQGCLLIAPGYEGADDETSNITVNCRTFKISCWTIEQFASVVEMAEQRKITASDILEIVLDAFAPMDVTQKVKALLSEPKFTQTTLYRGIIWSLRKLEEEGQPDVRDAGMLIGYLPRFDPVLKGIRKDEVRRALKDLASVSSGYMRLKEDATLFVAGNLDELERRVVSLTKQSAPPRIMSNFRSDTNDSRLP